MVGMASHTPVLFDDAVYARRLSEAARLCRERDLAGLVIGTGAELAYLTGSWLSSHERLTALVIPADGPPVLVAPATDIEDLTASAVPRLDIEVRGWRDGEDAHRLAVDALAGGDAAAAVGLGSSLTADHVLALQALLPGRRTVLATATLRELFTRKDDAELSELARAGAAIDAVHDQVPELLRAGRTEAEVAAELEQLILVDHVSVDFVIVGSGPNGANPHHSFSGRVLEEGDPVVVDLGGTLDTGYHSDCTRTYVVGGDPGKAPESFLDAYAVLEVAQAAALDAVRPGVTAEEIDRVARGPIDSAGYGRWFFHRTGHGIGLSTHEEPFLMAGNGLVLEEGMAFSIEPGIYLPGEWGMRIEDIVAVTGEGVERFNFQLKQLR